MRLEISFFFCSRKSAMPVTVTINCHTLGKIAVMNGDAPKAI